MNIKYELSSCIVTAFFCCVLASVASASSNFSEQFSALNIEERPCCKNNTVMKHLECPEGELEDVLNCDGHVYDMEIGINHIVVLDGVVQDHAFNHEVEYCTGVTDNGGAIIVRCLNNDARESEEKLFLCKGIMMLVSTLFTAATGYVYFIIPGRRETQDKATLSAVTYLTVSTLILGMEQPKIFEYIYASEPKAFVLYFCMISYFAWTNIVMAGIWKSTVARRWNIKESVWSVVIDYYAITVAVICTGWVFVHHRSYEFNNLHWWYYKKGSESYFAYIPMSVMLCISTTLLAWIIFQLQVEENSFPGRNRCILYLKLFLLSGLTWTFEILSFYVFQNFYNRSWFWLPIDAINCLHGVLLFFVLVMCRPNIKRELSGKRIFCWHCPADWGQPQDDEQEQLAEGDAGNGVEQRLQMSPTIDA